MCDVRTHAARSDEAQAQCTYARSGHTRTTTHDGRRKSKHTHTHKRRLRVSACASLECVQECTSEERNGRQGKTCVTLTQLSLGKERGESEGEREEGDKKERERG